MSLSAAFSVRIARAMVALGALCIPFSVQLTRGMTRLVSDGYLAFLGDRRIPAVSEWLVVRSSQSIVPLVAGFLIACVVLVAGWRLADPIPSRTRGSEIALIGLVFAGPFISVVWLGLVMVAAVLPLFTGGPIGAFPDLEPTR